MDLSVTRGQWVRAAVGAVVFTGLVFVLVQILSLGAMALAGDNSARVTRTLSRDYGVWGYHAAQRAGGAVDVTIHYDGSSVASLRALGAANREIADQLRLQGSPVAVRVTFRHDVDPAQFREWVQARGLQVHDSTLAASDVKGYSITLGIGAEKGDVLPQPAIDSGLATLSRQVAGGAVTPPLTVVGVYETAGTIAARDAVMLGDDPLVFVADFTANVVQRDLRAAGMGVPDQSQMGEPPPWGPMLRLGLNDFQ